MVVAIVPVGVTIAMIYNPCWTNSGFQLIVVPEVCSCSNNLPSTL
jgi:hypothetical protein